MKNSRIVMMLAVFGVIFLGAGAGFAQRKPIILGGYKTVPTTDEQVVAAAEFAVGKRAEENSEQEGLTLVSIEKAEMQSVQGANFRLCIVVGLDGEEQSVKTVIYRNLKQEFSLKSWDAVESCDEGNSEEMNSAFRKENKNAAVNKFLQQNLPGNYVLLEPRFLF